MDITQNSIEIVKLDCNGREVINKPFRLHNLPTLAQRHIFQLMDPFDVFYMTLFCPHHRGIVRSIRWIPGEKLMMNMKIEAVQKSFSLAINTGTNVIPVVECGWFPTKYTQKINERTVECIVQSYGHAHPKFLCDTMDSWFSDTFQAHFQNIFGRDKAEINVTIDPNNLVEGEGLNTTIPSKIRNFTLTKSLWYGQSSPAYKSSDMELFLKAHTVTRAMNLYPMMEGTVKFTSKLLEIDDVGIHRAMWFTGEHLLNFQGRHLFLKMASAMKTEDILNFLRGWRDGNQNILKTLMIFGGEFNPILVLGEFQANAWNPERRPRKYFSDSEQTKLHRLDDFLDCSTASDIKRSTDGLLASLKITATLFCFYVWH